MNLAHINLGVCFFLAAASRAGVRKYRACAVRVAQTAITTDRLDTRTRLRFAAAALAWIQAAPLANAAFADEIDADLAALLAPAARETLAVHAAAVLALGTWEQGAFGAAAQHVEVAALALALVAALESLAALEARAAWAVRWRAVRYDAAGIEDLDQSWVLKVPISFRIKVAENLLVRIRLDANALFGCNEAALDFGLLRHRVILDLPHSS